MIMKRMTYAKSGVDIEKEEEAIKGILSSIKSRGLGRSGHYAGMVEFGDYALVLCTDGVGSKIKIASELKKWDTIGIDCVAMNVNDALCLGAQPLAFVDYIAMEHPDPEVTKEIGKGLEEGARLSDISIVGGEIATLPEIVKGFDLAGTCLACVRKDSIVTGEDIVPGDAIIGLESSGAHSNGYTLIRKIIEKSGLSYRDPFQGGKTIGEVLLTPTRIYVKEILQMLQKVEVHGLAHITGGGLRNLTRLNSQVCYFIEEPLSPHPIFTFIQKMGNVEPKEMYRTFNMGMGFVVILPKGNVDKCLQTLGNHAKVVGEVRKGKGVRVSKVGIIK